MEQFCLRFVLKGPRMKRVRLHFGLADPRIKRVRFRALSNLRKGPRMKTLLFTVSPGGSSIETCLLALFPSFFFLF